MISSLIYWLYSYFTNVNSFLSQLKSTYDTGDFAIRYILSGEGVGEIFTIDKLSGEIHVHKSLDREKKAFYVLHAEAVDHRNGHPVEPESEFIIKVQDINDNAPHFINEPYTSSIPEMSPIGTVYFYINWILSHTKDHLSTLGDFIYSVLQFIYGCEAYYLVSQLHASHATLKFMQYNGFLPEYYYQQY